eukprot:PhM_4_TR11852/c0_g1_i1/m.65885/K00939/adk, AK; adenylate kinase
MSSNNNTPTKPTADADREGDGKKDDAVFAYYDVDHRCAFISEVDTPLGGALAQRYATGPEPYRVYGSVRDKSITSPDQLKWVHGIVNRRDDATAFKARVLMSDVVVCILNDTLEEATAAVKVLNAEHYSVEKTFVLVSSMMTWGATNEVLKEKMAAEAAAAAAEAAEEDAEVEPEEPEELPPLTEDGYQKRVPAPAYWDWKNLEHLTKKSNSDTLHTYVVWAGLQYGLGEDMLSFIFRRAYMNNASITLPNFNGGSNIVPTVHTADLAAFVHKLGTQSEPNAQRYFFGVDEGNAKWSSIVNALGALTDSQPRVVMPGDYCLYRHTDVFTVDMAMEVGGMANFFEDEWVSREGLVENMGKVWAEYLSHHNLTPLRLFVTGPPLSGKSHVAAAIASEYGVKHITIQDVIADYEAAYEAEAGKLRKIRYDRRYDKKKREAEEKRLAEENRDPDAEEGDAEPPEAPSPPPPPADDGEHEEGEEDAPAVDYLADMDDPEFLLLRALDQEGEQGEADAEAEAAEEEEDERLMKLRDAVEGMQKVIAMKHNKPKVPEGEEEEPEVDPEEEDKPKSVLRPWNPRGVPNAEKRVGSEATEVHELVHDVTGRYLDRALAMMARWRLQRPDCCIQGYVLDGFPKNVTQARILFKEGEEIEPLEAGDDGVYPEEELDDNVFAPAEDTIMPDHVVLLRSPENFLLQRLYTILGAKEHNTLQHFYRRYKAYMADVEGSDALTSLRPFFEGVQSTKGRDLVVREVNLASTALDRVTAATLREIKRVLGKPHNLGATAKQLADEHSRREAEADRVRRAEELRRQERDREVSQVATSDEDSRAREEARRKAAGEEQQMLASISDVAMREYLMSNVIPALTDVLQDAAELRPEDPVDFVANKLFFFMTNKKY